MSGEHPTTAQVAAWMRDAGWQNSALLQADLSAVTKVVRAALAQPAEPVSEIEALRAERDAPPDCRIYFHAHDGWLVEWLTAPPNGGQSNYYRAARTGTKQ